jgi:hypothetical protein
MMSLCEWGRRHATEGDCLDRLSECHEAFDDYPTQIGALLAVFNGRCF